MEKGRPKNIDLLMKQAQTDFTAYNMVVNGIGRKEPWVPSKFHHYQCQKVQKFIETETDNPYDVLIINTPPQHGKSLTISETLPSWYLGRNPEKRVLEVSYNSEFAENFGKRNRDKIAEFGSAIFGVGLSKATKSTKEWLLDNDIGGMKSCGFDGSITGRKGNLIIIDDPIKNRKDAHSETYRKNIWGAWRTDIKSRFHNGTKVIIIMTRWHEDDLAGRLIKTEKYLEVINLPIECVDENDPLYKLGFRGIGDALCPEINKDNKWVQDFKESYINSDPDDEEGGGLADWYSLYQGEPTIVFVS